MRKQIVILVLLVYSYASLPVRAQALTPDEKKFIDHHIPDLVTTETARIIDENLAKVFASPVYKITVQSSTLEALAARVGDKLVNISLPHTSADMSQLVNMFDPGFKLVTNSDAESLQRCLDVLYPIIGADDKALVKFTHSGNQWTFIRGKFIDSFTGYVISTDANGTVKSVKYLLSLP